MALGDSPTRATARTWRRPLAIATATAAALTLGAAGVTTSAQPAFAAPGDDSDARAELIGGTLFDAVSEDARNALTDAARTESGHPSDAGPHEESIDLSPVFDRLVLSSGDGEVRLLGDAANPGVLTLGPGAKAGLLHGYASSASGQESVAASGALGTAGTISAADGGTDVLTFDFAQLAGGQSGAPMAVFLELGAMASRAEQVQPDLATGDYLVSAARWHLVSQLLASQTEELRGQLDGIQEQLPVLLTGALGQQLLEVEVPDVDLGELAHIEFGTPTVEGTADLSGISDLVDQPLTDGAITIDLTTGTADIDLAELNPGGLNGLGPNTEVFNVADSEAVAATIQTMLGNRLADIATAIDEALLGTELTIDLHPVVVPADGAEGAHEIGATLTGSLEQFIDLVDTAPELTVTGAVALTAGNEELALDQEQLAAQIEPLVPDLRTDISAAWEDGLVPEPDEQSVKLQFTQIVMNGFPDLGASLPLVAQLGALVSLTVNVQEPLGDLGDDSFTIRAARITLLPGNAGPAIDIASSSVRTTEGEGDAGADPGAGADDAADPGAGADDAADPGAGDDDAADTSAEADADAGANGSTGASASADDDSAAAAEAAAAASATAAADGSTSALGATVRYTEIVRGTGVDQEVYVSGFVPGESVTATVHSTPFDLTGTADENGDVTFAFEVGSDFELGEHHVDVVGAASGEVPAGSAHTAFVVVAAEAGAELPTTGADVNPLVLGGALLLMLLGGGLAAAARDRRRA